MTEAVAALAAALLIAGTRELLAWHDTRRRRRGELRTRSDDDRAHSLPQ